MAVTGGGTGAINLLLSEGGGSSTLLEAIVPYSETSLKRFIKYSPDKYVSPETAHHLATKAYERAYELSGDLITNLYGIGCTCSLAKHNERKGRVHKIYVAVQGNDKTQLLSYIIKNRNRMRSSEESFASELIIYSLGHACGFGYDPPKFSGGIQDSNQDSEEILDIHIDEAPTKMIENLVNFGGPPIVYDSNFKHLMTYKPKIIFPGSFNPIHDGHLEMAELVYRCLSLKVDFEISLRNTDKPALNFYDIKKRMQDFCEKTAKLDYVGNMWFTNAPRFMDKSLAFPGAHFVVGVDTLDRMGKLKYYNHDADLRESAYTRFQKYKNRFLVFEREVDNKRISVDTIDIPKSLRKLCTNIGGVRKFVSASSTEIRNGK